MTDFLLYIIIKTGTGTKATFLNFFFYSGDYTFNSVVIIVQCRDLANDGLKKTDLKTEDRI